MANNQKNQPFNPRTFWGDIAADADNALFWRYYNLFRWRKNALEDLCEGASIPEGPGKIKNMLDHIYMQRTPGWTLQNNLQTANRTLNKFSAVMYTAKNEGRNLTEDDLLKNGLDRPTLQRTIKAVAEWIAWAYDQVVPNNVTVLYENVPEETVNRPNWEDVRIEDLSENPTPRFPVIFILDNALYMGEDLRTMKLGFNNLLGEAESDRILKRQLELYVATCGGGPREVVNFCTYEKQVETLEKFNPSLSGRSKMASTINMALDQLEKRLEEMRDPEVEVSLLNKPWMIVLTNGKFAEDMQEVSERIQTCLEKKQLQVYWRALSEKANWEVLSKLPAQNGGEAHLLTDVNGFFKDVNESLHTASQSTTAGGQISLINRTGFRDDNNN